MRSVTRIWGSELSRILIGLVLFASALACDALAVPIAPLVLYVLALIVSGIGVVGAIVMIIVLLSNGIYGL